MLLVTGPTGAGKTTTLYSCLNAIRDGKSNITTIEDPVEYRLPGLNQIQVNRSADVTFASALRSVLRQDPDVVMIGEIRDKETLEIALQAAQTGHLVLSTVHTNDAPSAISRLLALGGDPHLISTGLSGILAQRLLKKLCPDCAKAASPLYLKQHEDLFNDYSISQKSLLEPVGCEQCYELGYRGRIGIYSYLEMNDELAELVFTGASRESLSRAARRYGFRELDEAAVDLVNDAVVCLSEAKPYLQRKDTPASESLLDDLPNDHGKAVNPPIGRPSSTTPAPRPSVLIVDDNKFARKMLCAMLKDERVDIVQAENGRDALDKVFACAPAIILCDISMPEMDGRQFLEHMKRDKTTRDIPIIVLTADDCEHTELELFKLGAREFLSKRSAPELIAGRVRNVLNSR
jgi:CheY-like chemotaxis protein